MIYKSTVGSPKLPDFPQWPSSLQYIPFNSGIFHSDNSTACMIVMINTEKEIFRLDPNHLQNVMDDFFSQTYQATTLKIHH